MFKYSCRQTSRARFFTPDFIALLTFKNFYVVRPQPTLSGYKGSKSFLCNLFVLYVTCSLKADLNFLITFPGNECLVVAHAWLSIICIMEMKQCNNQAERGKTALFSFFHGRDFRGGGLEYLLHHGTWLLSCIKC